MLGRGIFCTSMILLVVVSFGEASDQPAADRRFDAAARQLRASLPDWKIHYVDAEPSVSIEGRQGYRLVMRRTHRVYTGPPQQALIVRDGPFELRHEDWEFFLFPVHDRPAPVEFKKRLKWQASDSPYHTRPVAMGHGAGFSWFSNSTIFMQDHVRHQLKLTGGDDPLQLAVEGCGVSDQGTMTANSVPAVFWRFGDDALPYIERAVKERREGAWRAVASLGGIQTERSTELIVRLYSSEDQQIRRSAAYALLHQPYRKRAKPIYLRLLKHRGFAPQAAAVCVRFRWRDAVPILRDICAEPASIGEFLVLYDFQRQLEGHHVPMELAAARQSIFQLMRHEPAETDAADVEDAKKVLIDSDDTDAANYIALSLAFFVTKGNTKPINQAGREVLKQRPRKSTRAFLQSLAGGVQNQHERTQLRELLREID